MFTFSESAFSNRNLKLDPRSSKLETRSSRRETGSSKVSRIENRVSRLEDRDASDCQLTFERYCRNACLKMWTKNPWTLTVNPKRVHVCILKITMYFRDGIFVSTIKSTRPHTFILFRLISFLQNPQVSGLHLHSVSRCWGRSAFFTNMPHSGCTQGSLTNSQLLVWACWKREKMLL